MRNPILARLLERTLSAARPSAPGFTFPHSVSIGCLCQCCVHGQLETQSFCCYRYPVSCAVHGQGAASSTVTAIRPDFLAELTFRRGAISAWLHTLPTSSGAGRNANVSHVPDVVLKGLMELASQMEGISRFITMTPEELRAHACKAAVSESSFCEDANPATAAGSAAATMGLVRSEWTSALSSKWVSRGCMTCGKMHSAWARACD